MIETVKQNSFVEFVKTETLKKGRVRTSVMLFLMDPEVFTSLCTAYILGEISALEIRLGQTIKHPADKYDKAVAKAEAAKKFKKIRAPISRIISNPTKTVIYCAHDEFTIEVIKKNDKIKIHVQTANNEVWW
jgi:hypothetical protein